MGNWVDLFRRWIGGQDVAGLADVRVVLYTRVGCHLCEDAWRLLEAERRRYRFSLQAVDVDTSADLAGRYGARVPVVTVGGKVRFRGGVNRVLLRRLLRAEAERRRGSG
jgi:glutaredoxin